jgi:hypothetical protein
MSVTTLRRLLAALIACGALLALNAGGSAAAPAPDRWCGDVAGSESDRLPDAITGYLVHVIYAIPADGADRFLERAQGIVRDLAAVDSWWQAQDPSRTPRFDYAAFPGCTTQFGNIDLSFVRLPQDAATYAAMEPSSTIALLLALQNAGFSARFKKYVVYYDGPVTASSVCGGSYSRPQGTTFAFVFANTMANCGSVGANDWAASTAAHELLHNLGAVPPNAPHQCDEGHVCDSGNDLMRGASVPAAFQSLADAILDVGHDDYYAHGGTWFDVQDSNWLTNPALPRFPLEIRAGAGGIAGISEFELVCRPTCTTAWEQGTSIVVTAEADEGFQFAGWSGPCSDPASEICELTVAGPTTLVAKFVRLVSLRVRVVGRGRVVSQPAGISCPRICQKAFAQGTKVRLVAIPSRGWTLRGWTGRCGKQRSCALSLSRSNITQATFVRT